VAGEWIQIEGGFRLTRSTSLDRADYQAEVANRAKRLREAIQKLADTAKQAPKIDRDSARQMIHGARERRQDGLRIEISEQGGGGVRQVFSSAAQTPATGAIHQVLAALDMNEIAAMPRGSRLVFAFTPTSVQRPLPSATRPIIERFIEEQRIWNEVLAEAGQSGRPALLAGGSPQNPGAVRGRLTEALLVVTRPVFGEGYQAHLMAVNEEGATLGSGGAFLAPASRPEPNLDWIKASENEQPIALSPISKEFIELVKNQVGSNREMRSFRLVLSAGGEELPVTAFSTGNEAKTPTISPELRTRILAPEKFEPTSMVPSEALLAIAEAMDTNLVACIPDSMLVSCARSFAAGDIKPSQALRQALTQWGLTRELREGWLVLRPIEPYSARRQRADRATLGKMLRSLDAHGTLTLDELAEWALKQEEPLDFQGLGILYFRVVNPAFADTRIMGAEFGERDMLRFWGSSSASQKQVLSRGQPLQLGALNTAQKEILRQMVYWSADGPQVRARGGGDDDRQGRGRGGFMIGLLGPSSLATERTEVLPNGVPSTGVVVMRVETSPAVLARVTGTNASQVMSARELAFHQVRKELGGEWAQLTQGAREYDQFRECTQVEMNFDFRLMPTVNLSRSLQDARFEANTRPGTYAQLSPRLRQMTDRFAEQMRRSMNEARFERSGPDRGGRRTPPPQP